jgi:fucose 4-O-acetylase-like acetyltransferase
MSFYALSHYLKSFIFNTSFKKRGNLIMIIAFTVHLVCSLFLIVKVDMYRSTYSNEFLFLLNAYVAICFWLLVFRSIKKNRILSFFGKNTIPVLALHLRMLTVIKLFLLVFLSAKTFSFNEVEKVILVIAQLMLLYPIIILINKYAPILNGKTKTKTRN